MKTVPHLDIAMPDLSQEAAYALVDWLECLVHEVSLYYCDEIRSEIIRREKESDYTHENCDGFDDPTLF